MNTDDFEKQLQRQPLRQVPGEWRADILRAAEASTRNSKLEPQNSFWLSTLSHQLSTILWPHPKAWFGLVAAWIVIFALHFASRDNLPRMAKTSVSPPREMMLSLKEEQKMVVELMGADAEPREMERPKRLPPQPRSERRQMMFRA